eukprot:13615412-Alexandrium_andersonii.AAC.1
MCIRDSGGGMWLELWCGRESLDVVAGVVDGAGGSVRYGVGTVSEWEVVVDWWSLLKLWSERRLRVV